MADNKQSENAVVDKKRPPSALDAEKLYGDVPEIVPLNDYDRVRAKEKANIKWLITKAYGGEIPENFRHLYFTSEKEDHHLKPAIVNKLSSGELYSLASASIFHDPNFKGQPVSIIIQFLSRKGICPMERSDAVVTEASLLQTSPVKLSAHIAMIDALMMAFITEAASGSHIAYALKCLGVSSSESPEPGEQGLILWANKVMELFTARLELCRVGQVNLPKLNNLAEDLSDGQCFALLLSFYCPEHLRVSDIYIKHPMSLGDSLYNLQLCINFCRKFFPSQPFVLALEDMIYTPAVCRLNIQALLAELFYHLEVNPVNSVREKHPAMVEHHSSGLSSSFTRARQPVQISSSPGKKTWAAHSPGKPKFVMDTDSLCDPQERKRHGLLPKLFTEQQHPRVSKQCDDMEVESVSSGPELPSLDNEPLMPARLKVNKERLKQSKNMERGEDPVRLTKPGSGNANALGLVGKSFTLHDSFHTANSARAAGIPVIDDHIFGMKSDSQEADLSLCRSPQNNFMDLNKSQDRPPVNGEIHSDVYMHHNPGTVKESDRRSPKSNLEDSPKKRTTFAALPNQTTWAASAQQKQPDGSSLVINHAKPLNAELTSLRMRLEEKRKKMEIQRKQMEAHLAKHRQRMGKQAFMQVVKGGKPDRKDDIQEKDEDLESNYVDRSATFRVHKANDLNSKDEGDRVFAKSPPKSDINYATYKLDKAKIRPPLEESGSAKITRNDNVEETSAKAKRPMTKSEIEDILDKLRQRWLSESTDGEGKVDAMNEDQISETLHEYETKMQELQSELTQLEQVAMADSRDSATLAHELAAPVGTPSTLHQPQQTAMQQHPPSTAQPVMPMMPPQPAYVMHPGFAPPHSHSSPQIYPQFQYSPHYQGLPSHPVPQQQLYSGHGMPHFSPYHHGQYNLYYDPQHGYPHPPYPQPYPPYGFQPSPPQHYSGSQEHLHNLRHSQENLRASPDRAYRGTGHTDSAVQNAEMDARQPAETDNSQYASDQQQERKSPEHSHTQEQQAKELSNLETSAAESHSLESSTYSSSSEPVMSYTDRAEEKTSKITGDVGPLPGGDNQGFVISFDDGTPRKRKPKLKGKKNGKKTSQAVSEQKAPEETEPADIDAPPPPPQYISPMSQTKTELRTSVAGSTPPAKKPESKQTNKDSVSMSNVEETTSQRVEAAPGVAFELGQTESDKKLDDEEMMRRKEKIMLSALKRKEKQEQRRLQIEMENAKRREELQLKQEEAERKKEEEKIRRQLIWEDYQRRKLEAQLNEQGGAAGDSPPVKLKQKPKANRPKSLLQENSPGQLNTSPNFRPKSMFQEETVEEDEGNGDYIYSTRRREPSPRGRGSPPSAAQAFDRFSSKASDQMSESSNASEVYAGPKLFVKPSAKSNRGIVMNAINYRCLAGTVNEDLKKRVLDALSLSESNHFLVLFRDNGCQFRALYSYDPESDLITKLCGTGPKTITHKMCHSFYKYDSGAKHFTAIPSKHLSATIDAFTIHDKFWQSSKKQTAISNTRRK